MFLSATRKGGRSLLQRRLLHPPFSHSHPPPPRRRSFGSSVIKHVVMFDLLDETEAEDVERVKESLLNLPKEIPTIQSFELGQDLLLPSGQSHPGKNRRLCWSCTFPDVQSYEAYRIHAAHQNFLTLLKPLVLPGSRAAIQYLVKT